jgi:Carboxypeptidase regulatory-like domain/TonB dependent receptor
MSLRTVLFGAALVSFAASAEAQLSTGSIIGVIRDESNAVLPGASVEATSPALPGGPATDVTNAQGEYRITRLPPGTYLLRVTLAGFRTYQEADLRVLVGGTVERVVTLAVAAVEESVTVSGQSPVVDPRRAGIANSLAAEQLEAAASERYGVQAYMAMLPGVTTGNYNRVFNVNVMGSNSNETTFLTDGVSFSNLRAGGAWLLSDFDGAQEVSVQTLGASAEYQAAGGGVLNVVGKVGTNAFHGDAAGFWSPDALTSSPVKLCPGGAATGCADSAKIGFHWYDYYDSSAHVGGPIKRNRVWFFSGLIYRGRYGTPPGQPATPDRERFLDWITDTNTKVTWKVTDKVQFQQTYYGEIWGTVNPNFTSPTRPIETLQHSEAGIKDDPNTGSQVTWVMSSKTMFTARYGLTKGASHRIGFFRDLDTPNHTDLSSAVQTGNTNAHRFWPRRDEVNVKVNTFFSGSRIEHNLAYGVQISRNKDVFVQIEPGGVIFQDNAGLPNQATLVGPDARGASSSAQGLWAEDELTFGDRVTVRPGVRYDRMVGTSTDVPQFDLQFNEVGTLKGAGHLVTWNQVSPRIGLNVKLTADGKTVVRAVAGRYYLPLFLGEFEDLHPGRALRTIAGFNPSACPGATIATETASCFTNVLTVTDPNRQVRFDGNTKAPYTDQFAIGMDREIARNLGVAFNIIHKRGGNELGWVDTGGTYGAQALTVSGQTPFGQAVNQTLTVFPLLNASTQQLFLRTNGTCTWPGLALPCSDYYNSYDALILTATRRLANRWQFTAGYTRQRSKGLEPAAGSRGCAASTCGRDPNDYINLDGGLGARDRPNMFSLMGSYEVPRVGVQVSGNLTAVSGTAIPSQTTVRLAQGTRTINLDAPGSVYRTAEEKFMHVRLTKMMFRSGPRRLELTGEVKNTLNEIGSPDIRSSIFNNANFLLANTYPEPRQLRLFARWFF